MSSTPSELPAQQLLQRFQGILDQRIEKSGRSFTVAPSHFLLPRFWEVGMIPKGSFPEFQHIQVVSSVNKYPSLCSTSLMQGIRIAIGDDARVIDVEHTRIDSPHTANELVGKWMERYVLTSRDITPQTILFFYSGEVKNYEYVESSWVLSFPTKPKSFVWNVEDAQHVCEALARY